MISRDTAYSAIADLVERFNYQEDFYKKGDYNEALTRKDYIDPFFEALGWDMNNKQGAWEPYREVLHEDKLKIAGITKAPDYSFRLVGGQRLFFVEAKRPSVVVKDDVAPAYQVRLYGWNANLPLSVVTDFEEFAIYDCTKKPSRIDKASTARVNYFTFKDYLHNFEFFWNTFSKEQIIKGGLAKFQQAEKKGTATVDEAFLESLDDWRKLLAGNIFKNNPGITEDELNLTVQQNIDRIIFLRIAEDRGLEPWGHLKSSLQSANHYHELYRLFRMADDKYNSGLFHFRKEKNNAEAPDIISGKITIENKVIKSIIDSLYPPNSDYLFNVLPVEILGSAYEQFLGKQITIKAAKATVEEKPEVRKAGGVYYTPQYIVDYIVKQSVGKLCEGKTVEQISKIKIVDPACGSGSFLLGAYQYLLNKHIQLYRKKILSKKQKEAILTPEGNLTTAEKKRILINNIYGVDIDHNAVEVTKLSLLLKCMEGETQASISTQLALFHDRALPSLEKNIKCGNSIIDFDIHEARPDISSGAEKKLRAFNWEQAFSSVFQKGGFDSVIGNPPFIQLSAFASTTEIEKKYLVKTYHSSMGRLNTFGFFIAKGLRLLKNKGYLGFIIPNTITTQDYYEELRKLILDVCSINTIVNFDKLLFKDAVVENIILIAQKEADDDRRKSAKVSVTKATNDCQFNMIKCVQQDIFYRNPKNTFNVNIDNDGYYIKLKMESNSEPLKNFLEVNQAIALKTDRSKWVSNKKKNNQFKPLLVGGRNINRYSIDWDGTYLHYNPEGIHSCKREDIFLTKEKIFFRRVANRLIAALDTEQFYGLHTLVVMNPKPGTKLNIRFFLGLFNSKVMNYYYSLTFASTKKVFSEVGARQVQELPIRSVDLNVKAEKILHDGIVKLVGSMINLQKKKKGKMSYQRLQQLEQQINYTDNEINKLVSKHYGLTDREIKVIENVLGDKASKKTDQLSLSFDENDYSGSVNLRNFQRNKRPKSRIPLTNSTVRPIRPSNVSSISKSVTLKNEKSFRRKKKKVK